MQRRARLVLFANKTENAHIDLSLSNDLHAHLDFCRSTCLPTMQYRMGSREDGRGVPFISARRG